MLTLFVDGTSRFWIHQGLISGIDSGGAGGAIAPPEFGGSEKGRSLISAYQSLAITASTSGFEKLSIVGADWSEVHS